MGVCPTRAALLTAILNDVRLNGSARRYKKYGECFVYQQVAAVLGVRATAELATSDRPEAPVRTTPPRRHRRSSRRLSGLLPWRGR